MERINHLLTKVFLFLVLASAFVFLTIVLDRIFALASPPKVVEVFPGEGTENTSLKPSLVISFDKPLKRQEVRLSIFPEAHGEWSFQRPLIKNHFFRTIIFTPAIDLNPGTSYLVKVENVKGFGLDDAGAYQFSFKTQLLPEKTFSGKWLDWSGGLKN